MPNWCEGTLKIRGNVKNVERWCKENINIYIHSFKDGNYSMQRDNDNPVKIDAGEDEIEINVPKDAYIKGTSRNFVEEGYYLGLEHNGVMRLALNVKSAWDFESKPYVEMSKDYDIDFRFYGFECGNEFCQEVIIENGELKADNKIIYDDYFWECPFPNLGG